MKDADLVTHCNLGQIVEITPDQLRQAIESNPELVDALILMITDAERMGLPPKTAFKVTRTPNARPKRLPGGSPTRWDVSVWDTHLRGGALRGHAYCEDVDLPTAQAIQNTAQVVLEFRKTLKENDDS